MKSLKYQMIIISVSFGIAIALNTRKTPIPFVGPCRNGEVQVYGLSKKPNPFFP